MSHLTKILLLALILAAVIVLPSCATNLIYPGGYYSITNRINEAYSSRELTSMNTDGAFMAALELHRQNYLIEKQNELLAEQNALLANQSLVGHTFTCTDSIGARCLAWTVT